MKKLILWGIITLLVAFSLTACGEREHYAPDDDYGYEDVADGEEVDYTEDGQGEAAESENPVTAEVTEMSEPSPSPRATPAPPPTNPPVQNNPPANTAASTPPASTPVPTPPPTTPAPTPAPTPPPRPSGPCGPGCDGTFRPIGTHEDGGVFYGPCLNATQRPW